MRDELADLLDTAIYKEVATQAFYIAGQAQTEDPGARALLKELSEEELRHAQRLKEVREKGWQNYRWQRKRIPNLMLSEYLVDKDSLAGAGLQDTLLFAIKREQQSVGFYSRMTGVVNDEAAKSLCRRL